MAHAIFRSNLTNRFLRTEIIFFNNTYKVEYNSMRVSFYFLTLNKIQIENAHIYIIYPRDIMKTLLILKSKEI